jgi:hypothetical protein
VSELLAGKVQAGFGDASRWLKLFNAAYSEKLEMPVFPGSLNIALDHVFDWFDARYETHRIWFGREEYGGERDILAASLRTSGSRTSTGRSCGRRRLRQGIDEILGSSRSSLTSI